MLCLFVLLACSYAQLPPIEWSECILTSTQRTDASASPSYLEKLVTRDHWQDTIETFQAHFASQKRQIFTDAQCAWVSVPAIYSTDPAMNGTVHEDASAIKYIQVRVARFLYDKTTPSKQAVWHFAGGPGQNSVELFGKLLETLSKFYASDVYVMNLRGISGPDSSDVDFWDSMTPSQLEFQVSLMQNSTYQLLPYFTTDDNCRDLKRVMDTVYESHPKQDIVLVGHSYGTYFVHRFVQMFPSVAIRAILDSTCAGPKGTIIDMLIWANTYWFPQLIDKCSKDDFCNRVFDGKPNATIMAALSDRNKTCGNFKATDAFRFTSLLLLNQPTNFQISFAILKRFSRCNSDDVSVLAKIANLFQYETLVDSWKNTPPKVGADLNPTVMYQMRGSEFGRLPTPTDAQLAQEMSYGAFGQFSPSPTVSLYTTRRTNDLPWTAVSPWANLWAPSNFTKFFLISGEIDFNTPIFLSEDFIKHVPDTKWFVVPAAGHTAGLATKCGFSVLKQWIIDGGDAPGCGIPPLSFQVPDATSTSLGFFNWYGSMGLSSLGIGLIVAGCLLVVAVIAGFIGVRMCKKKRTDEARLPLIH